MNSSLVQTMMMIIAKVRTKDQLVADLEETISEYKADKSEKNFAKLKVCCSMIISKDLIEHDENGLEGVLEEMEKFSKREEIFTVKPN